MSAAAGFGASIAGGALAMLAQSAALAALAWAAWSLGVLRKRPAAWAAIWTIVLFKLVLPWGPQVAGSLSDLWSLAWRAGTGSSEPLQLPVAAVAVAPEASLSFGSLMWIALGVGWLTITGRRIARSAMHLRQQRRELAALPTAPRWLTELCGELAARFGVIAPTVMVHPARVVPHLLYGVRGSQLVIPSALVTEDHETFDARPAGSEGSHRHRHRHLLELTLAHELAHLRRRDPLARWLLTVVSAVWFFLPIRTLIGRPLERAQEVAADALALRILALPPATYARLLVDVTVRCQEVAPRPALALARPRAPGALIERVEALCLHRSQASAGWGGAAFLVGFALIGLGQARQISTELAGQACEFSPEIAEALREVHPEADRDGDGELGREEACALQEQLRRTALEGLEGGGDQASRSSHAGSSSLTPGSGASGDRPLWQRLCCQCEPSSVREVPLAERASSDACVHE